MLKFLYFDTDNSIPTDLLYITTYSIYIAHCSQRYVLYHAVQLLFNNTFITVVSFCVS